MNPRRFDWAVPTFSIEVRFAESIIFREFAIATEELFPGVRVLYQGKRARANAVTSLPPNAPIELRGPLFLSASVQEAMAKNPMLRVTYVSSDTTTFGTMQNMALSSFYDLINSQENLERVGRELFIHAKPYLKQGVDLYPYQFASVGLAAASNSQLLVIPPGGGKTRTTLIAAFARVVTTAKRHNVCPSSLPIFIVGPDITWDAWDLQSIDITPMLHTVYYDKCRKASRIFKFEAVSYRNDRSLSLEDYQAYCKMMKIPAIYYVNDESLPALFAEIREAIPYPGVLIFDEIHTMSSHERTQVSYSPTGEPQFNLARTATTNQATRAAARNELSKLASIFLYIGLSATPISDGKHRRVFAPVDLICPYYFGVYSSFRQMFTLPKPNAYSEFDDSYSKNHDLLNARLKPILWEVPPAVVKQYMPSVSYQARWIDPAEFKGKNVARIRIEEPDEIEDTPNPGGSAYEKQLAQACQVKNGPVGWSVAETVAADINAKVLVFVGRKKQAGLYADTIKKDIRLRWRGDQAPSTEQPEVIEITGNNTALERREAVKWFMAPNNGAAKVLVATYQFMGMSIDGLQCATHMEVAMFPPNPGIWNQLVGRVERLGGVGCQVRIWLARRTYDETIYSVFTSNANSIALTLPDTGKEVALLAVNLRDEETYAKLMAEAPFNFTAWDDDE